MQSNLTMMDIFNDHYNRIDESRDQARAVNSRLIESVLEIGNEQKTLYIRQKTLSDIEAEIADLQTSNKEIKTQLLKALVERDEILTKRSALKAMNERLYNQNENLHRETDDLLRGDEVDSICERFSFSEQISLLKEIQDARCKLIKFGFPLSFFA